MLKITHLQRFSLHDGPGIRTTVFCKGCSMRCSWCHNPETVESAVRLWHNREQCITCGSCRRNCPQGLLYGEGGCDCTEQTGFPCADACPAGALAPTGFQIEEAALFEQLLRDRSYYERTGGGITFSGGEPLFQAGELCRIMDSDRLEGISRAIDTAGNVRWENICEVLPRTDLFLYDVKCMDPVLHKKGTGVDNGMIQENLERLCRTGKVIWIRIPVIPGWNDSDCEMRAIARRLGQLSDIPRCGIQRIELLAFHRFGREKYERLGWTYPAEEVTPPPVGRMEKILSHFHRVGLRNVEIGNHSILIDQQTAGRRGNP